MKEIPHDNYIILTDILFKKNIDELVKIIQEIHKNIEIEIIYTKEDALNGYWNN